MDLKDSDHLYNKIVIENHYSFLYHESLTTIKLAFIGVVKTINF